MTRYDFLKEVETFIKVHSITATAFGKLALGQPMFVFQLRMGRECREATQEKVLNFMKEFKD